MGNKRNQVIAIARFLAYKAELNKQMENMSEEQYMQNPIGLDVGQYVEDMMKYCTEHTVDTVLKNQDEMIARLGMEYLSAIAFMPYIDGVKHMPDSRPNPNIWETSLPVERLLSVFMRLLVNTKGADDAKENGRRNPAPTVIDMAQKDGENLCFTDELSSSIVADELIEQGIVTDPEFIARQEALKQLDDAGMDTGLKPLMRLILNLRLRGNGLKLVYICSPLRSIEENIKSASIL